MLSRHRPSILRAVILSAALLSMACDDGKDPIGPAPTLTASVSSSATGNARLRCSDTDFEDSEDLETVTTVTSGSVSDDPELPPVEVFEFGDFALYVPACVTAPRALILALGGPDTRGFVTGKPLGAPIPAVEASLQVLGQSLRTLASRHGLAVLGSSRRGMSNLPANDQLLFDAVATAAALSGRPKLSNAPVLLYGLSGGAPQASGFTVRNPERVAGLFLKVPAGVSDMSGNSLRVPTYMVQAEVDAFVNNGALTAAFERNRGAGALWALAMEPGVIHHSLSAVQRDVTINWMRTILRLRLRGNRSHRLRDIAQTSGWLGDRVTGEATRWFRYRGDRALASWLPSSHTAKDWEKLVAAAPIP